MNFFKKLFGLADEIKDPFSIKDDKTLAFEQNDEAAIISAKFFFMVVAESSNEGPKINDVYEILDSSFPECPRNSAFDISVKVIAMQKVAQNDSSIWLKIYDNFFSQLIKFSAESRKSIITEISDMAFTLKESEGMESLAETYVYRMQLNEKHSGMTKSDYVELLNEKKNKLQSKDKEINKSQHKNKTEKNHELNPDLPHYILKAQADLEIETKKCNEVWGIYKEELEKLIKRSHLADNDKEILEKNLKHGIHGNFDKINLKKHLGITCKLVLKLGIDSKQKFKLAESKLPAVLNRYSELKENLNKMMVNYKKGTY